MIRNRFVVSLTVCSAMTAGVMVSGSSPTLARSDGVGQSTVLSQDQIASMILRSARPPRGGSSGLTTASAEKVRRALNRVAARARSASTGQASGVQGDEFNGSTFSAPFRPVCASNATQPCPDPQSGSSWSLNGQRPGYLRIMTQPGSLLGTTSQGSNNARNMILQPFDAGTDWKAATSLSFAKSTNNPVPLGQTAGLMVYQDDDNFLFVGRVLSPSGVAHVEFVQEAAGVDTVTSVAEGKVFDSIVYLRLIKSGNVYQASYSDNGGPYVQIAPGDTGAAAGYTASYAAPQVGLFTFGGLDPRVSGSTIPADFDWFRVADAATSLPAPTPVPTPPPPKPHLSIVDIRPYDNGQSSAVVYYRHHAAFSVRYRLVGARAQAGRAVFELSTHAGTLRTYRMSIRGRKDGTISVQIGDKLPVGRKKLSASIWIGKLHGAASRYFTVVNPPAFFIHPASGLAEVARVRTARVEDNGRAQKEDYTLHLNRTPFRKEGRLTGYYEVLDLRWPSLDQSQEVIRTDLVSVYASAQRARSAFEAQRGVYEAAAIGKSQTLKVRALGIASGLGDCCRAAYLTTTSYGLHVEETFFVRGQILVQQWTWFTGGALSKSLSKAIANAFQAMSKTLDSIAWSQQV